MQKSSDNWLNWAKEIQSIAQNGLTYTKDVFDKIGLFDTSIKAGEVISLTMKMKESNLNIKKIDFVSSNRRIHDTNYGKVNKKNEFSDYASILRNKLRK